MITGISIENFKGIRERVEIAFRPLTLLFGANSAGKSSILNALQYAAELFERHNADTDQTVAGGPFVNLGGFASFVHGHDLDRTVWITLHIRDNQELYTACDEDFGGEAINDHLRLQELGSWANSFGASDDGEVEVGIRWDHSANRPHIAVCRVYLAHQLFAEITSEPGAKRVYLSRLNVDNPCLTTLEGWDVRSLEEQTEHPLAELFPNFREACLSICLSDSFRCFQRIQGESSSNIDKNAPLLLLKDMDCALPHPGRSVQFALKSVDETVPSINLKESNEQKRAEEWHILALANETAAGLSQLISAPITLVTKYLSELRSLGPIREVPERNHVPLRHGERERWASGIAAWDRLEMADDDDSLVDSVSQWLGDADRLNSGYRLRRKKFKELDLRDPLLVQLLTGRAFDEAEMGTRLDLSKSKTRSRLQIETVDGSLELRPSDVGIGISQVVPVIVTALDGKSRLLAIEQPELHIHPRLQAELADLFLDSALTLHHRFLIETHSEHLLLRIQRRIRETTKGHMREGRIVRSEDVVLYHISAEDGSTCVRRIDVDAKGEFIQPWPDDFFEIDFYERFGHDR